MLHTSTLKQKIGDFNGIIVLAVGEEGKRIFTEKWIL